MTDLTGQTAPDFTLPRDGGGSLTLSGLQPKAVVLYFYPKDDTSGCTRESIEFTEKLQDFTDANCEIIGLSRDNVRSHDKFRDKHDLGVALVSDEDGAVCEAYGTWVEKKMYGRTFMGIQRSTFLIDGTGTVQREWRNVKVPGHVDAVLDAVRAL